MEHVWMPVLGITVLLSLAVLTLPIANRLNLPYTVVLAVVGCALGTLIIGAGNVHGLGPISDFIIAIENFSITSDAILFIFLPALVFESALQIDVRRLLEDLGPILFLAVVGVLVSTAIVGGSVALAGGPDLVTCLLLGAIVSATDPVAVVAIFKELGAPKRLAMLVEGESLFNDATAIVLFSILAAMVAGGGEADWLAGTFEFVKVFVGGVVVGFLLGRATCFVIGRLRKMPLVDITLTIALAFLSFIAAEHYLHVSGVMAAVTAALVMGSVGRAVMLPKTWHTLIETWEQIGFWFNSLIFVFVGIAVPGILADIGGTELVLIVVLLVSTFAARALIVFVLLPMMQLTGFAGRVGTAFKTVMFWGGLRGAVSLALALAIIESPDYSPEMRSFIGVLVTVFVLFTLFVNATTISVVLRLLGLDQLSATDLAVRDRALMMSLSRISERLQESAKTVIDQVGGSAADVVEGYAHRLERVRGDIDLRHDLAEDDWLRIGLTILAGQERRLYVDHFANGYVSPDLARSLLAGADDLIDGLKQNGVDGYRRAAGRRCSYGRILRLALILHRRLGIERPLAYKLGERFELLLATRTVLKELVDQRLPGIMPLVGTETAVRLGDIIDSRLEQTEQALHALELQYPGYAHDLQSCHLGRLGLRLEDAQISQMLDESVISKEVYDNLDRDLQSRAEELERRPRLDLELEPAKLVAKVPFFTHLDPDRIAEIAHMLKPQLAVPGERIVAKGEIGDAMYFISTGAVEVEIPPEPVHLGSGDFFGEISLVMHQPRNADVVALGYCQLLALYTRDFSRMLQANPALRDAITETAGQRLAALGKVEADQLG